MKFLFFVNACKISLSMLGLLLSQQPLVRVFFLEPGVLLFGLLLMLMSVSVALVFLLKKVPSLMEWFLWIMALIHFILWSILASDLVSGVNRVYTTESFQRMSALFASHRWILIQVPLLLTFTACVLGWVCRNDLQEKHTQPYMRALIICVCVSFLSILLIGFESLV